MKRMVLAFVLVTFSSCVVHAAESSSKDKGVHGKKEDKRAKKDKPTDDVVYLDMSKDDGTKEDDMPTITKKGPL